MMHDLETFLKNDGPNRLSITKDLGHGYVLSVVNLSENDLSQAFLGGAREELLDILKEELRPKWEDAVQGVMLTGRSRVLSFCFPVPSGRRHYEAYIVPQRAGDGPVSSVLIISREITGQKQDEERMARVTRLYSVLSKINEMIFRIRDPAQLYQEACRIAVDDGGFRMAWIGLLDEDEDVIHPVAHHGLEDGYLDQITLSVHPKQDSQDPTGLAIRTGNYDVCNDIESDMRMPPWREAALRRGYLSCAAFPIRLGNRVIGAVSLYSALRWVFNGEEVRLMQQLADNISFAVQSADQDKQLQNATKGTIEAVARLVEMRDPYTAGHQCRVAKLACAISRAMGLAEERVNGIRFAALIHDVGKIPMPAEVIHKPARLSPIEMKLIEMHPRVGYDVLKNVDFPWPVADIVLQHHERLDGSGYPEGLKGRAILLDAQILAVADVIEAMGSARSYRPSYSLDRILEEIRAARGTAFDESVVDTAIKLLESGEFSFESEECPFHNICRLEDRTS